MSPVAAQHDKLHRTGGGYRREDFAGGPLAFSSEVAQTVVSSWGGALASSDSELEVRGGRVVLGGGIGSEARCVTAADF